MKKLNGALAAALLLSPMTALAQAYPTRPVTVVIAFAPGASTDIEARIYNQKLTELTGQSFVMDYKPGAGTTIGNAYVAKATPDGYTLQAITGGFNASPALYPKLSYDPVKDFAPISLMSRRTTLIVTNADTPYKTLKEYIAYARANPGKVNVATTGAGGSPHLNAAWFHQLINARPTYVHYKASAPAQTDLMAGRVDLYFTTALSAVPHLKSGRQRALSIANLERSPLFPDLLPASELGAPGFDYSSIFGYITQAAVPQPIIAKLASELQKTAKDPDVAKRIENDGGFMVGSTPAQFRDIIVTEIARFRKIVQENNIKLEE